MATTTTLTTTSGLELGSLNLALNRAAAGLKQISGAQANTAHNLNAEQAIAGRTKETFFTVYDNAPGPDALVNNSSATGILEGKPWNHIGKAGAPVQSLEKTHLALTADRCFFPVKDSNGNLYFTRVGSFKPNANNVYANHFGMILQYVPATGGSIPTTVSQASFQPLSTAGLSLASSKSDTITVNAGLSGEIGNSVQKNFNIIDSTGTPRTLMFNFTRAALPAGSTNSQAWALTVTAPPGSAVAPPYNGNILMEFDSNGLPAAYKQSNGMGGYTTLASLPNLDITWPGASGAAPSALNLNLGNIGQANGMVVISGGMSFLNVISNGYPSGTLNNLTFNENGQIYATFSNNQSQLLGQLPLGMFNNPDGLEPLSMGLYTPTTDSGAVSFYYAGSNPAVGQIASGALEGSNVNVITEMANMVQRELQFNVIASVSSTTKNMWETVTQVI